MQKILLIKLLTKFSASASQMSECSDGPKYWLIDIDKTGMTEITEEQVEQIVKDFEYIFLDKKVIKFKILASLTTSKVSTFLSLFISNK